MPWPLHRRLLLLMPADSEDGMAYGDSPQQQLKRARLDHTHIGSSERWSSNGQDNGSSPERGQALTADGGPDIGTGQGPAPMQQGVHQGGHHFHWIPMFCQMGGLSNYEGHAPGSLAGSWMQSMPSVPNMPAQLGAQGGLQPYPCMGPQPDMLTPAAAAASADPEAVTAQQATQQGSLTASAVDSTIAIDSRHLLVHGGALTDSQSALASDMQQHTQAGTAKNASDGPSSQHNSMNAAQIRTKSVDLPLGMAACLPKLDKKLSNCSCEDLTAKAVAKLWGVNLRRYTGHST